MDTEENGSRVDVAGAAGKIVFAAAGKLPFPRRLNRSRISLHWELIWDMSDRVTADLRAAMAEGHAHHIAGRFQEAEAIYRKVLAVEPNHPDALHLLGMIAMPSGNYALVAELIGKAIVANPRVPAYHNNLGVALKELGRLEEAVAAYRQALSLNPDYAEAYNNLGNALSGLGRREDAVEAYNKTLALRPDYAEAHNNLGNALKELGLTEEAAASYGRALVIAPNYVAAYSNLGVALKEQGKLEEAVAAYRQALAIAPDYAEALYNLCELFEKTNRTEDLREAVNSARQHCPGDPRFALREAQLLARDSDYAAARAVLEAAGDDLADDGYLAARTTLLGELCDRLGDAQAAFDYFTQGNRRAALTAEAKRSDGRAYQARIDALATHFTADWVAGWSKAAGWSKTDSEDDRADPVFLVGFPRSGTTLLDTILSSHRAITVVEEIPAVRNLRVAVEQLPGGYPDALSALGAAELAALRKVYFAALDKHLEPQDPSTIIVDKLPLNSIEAGLIQRIFPSARFLFAQRHPCDCVLSCFMQSFEINDAMVNFLDLEDAARLYDKVMALWLQYQAVLPLAVHTLRYESLIEGLEETLTPLLDFLGLDWDDGIKSYAETAQARNIINTPSYNQVTQPLYTRSRGRWERYREPMQPALPLLLPWARRFGYDDPQ